MNDRRRQWTRAFILQGRYEFSKADSTAKTADAADRVAMLAERMHPIVSDTLKEFAAVLRGAKVDESKRPQKGE